MPENHRAERDGIQAPAESAKKPKKTPRKPRQAAQGTSATAGWPAAIDYANRITDGPLDAGSNPQPMDANSARLNWNGISAFVGEACR